METIFPKSEYAYTTEILKAIKYQKTFGGLQSRTNGKFKELNGKEFTLPYNRYDTMLGKEKNFLKIVKKASYLHPSSNFDLIFQIKFLLIMILDFSWTLSHRGLVYENFRMYKQ